MKRFFRVFSIILILFLVLAAGAVVVVDYGAVRASGGNAWSMAGWGITVIPFDGNNRDLRSGDLFIIKKATAEDVIPGHIVLYAAGNGAPAQSGFVNEVTESKFSIEFSGGMTSDVPRSGEFGIYKFSIPHMVALLDVVKQPISICVFAAVLLASIILWRALPGKSRSSFTGLSESDGEIASNLY
jgi:hypothetical protein